MTAAYIPQPGTIAARALAWFADQAPECEASTGVIAAALDQPIAIVFQALEDVFRHGRLAREKRDGVHFWSTSHRAAQPLGAPPPVCGDDDDPRDLLPVRQTVVPASTPKETAMPAATPATPPQAPKPKKPRAAPPEFDPLTIGITSGRPLPASTRAAGPSRYQVLLGRMKPGDSVDLPHAVAKGLISAGKRAQIKLASRVISENITGVWRL